MGYQIYIENLSKKQKNKPLLSNINLKIKPNTLNAILGVSGAGKTTLLNAISGYDTNYKGNIYYNNYNLKTNDLREEISYVPQGEILHTDLTLKKELYYAIKLQKKKQTKKQINQKIIKVINELELNGKENTPIKNLSGGEKKRLMIALELINDPKVLILDEPTSGLDLNVEKKLMKILKNIAQKGTTIITTLHTVSNLNLCDKIYFIAKEGKICYEGTQKNALQYFNVQSFVDIYELLQTKSLEYNQKYNQTFQKEKILEEKYKIKTNQKPITTTFTLARRYLEIIYKDKFLLFMILFQGFIIALVTVLAIENDGMQNYDKAKIILFASSCTAMWTGLFNSIQEIVKERQITKKEYMKKISITSYIISKLIVLINICLIQSIIFITTLYLGFTFPKEGLITTSYIDNIVHFFIISLTSSCIGLFFSSILKKRELTLIIATLYMMIQLIASGVLLKLNGLANKITHLILGRYAQEGFGAISNLEEVVKTTTINNLSPEISEKLFMKEANEYYAHTTTHLITTWEILIITSIVIIILTIIALNKNIKKETP